MIRYIFSAIIFISFSPVLLAQRAIGEFPTKNRQFNFQALPFGDSILLFYDEVVGPNGRSAKDVKWISKSGSSHDVFCPVDVFAIESEADKIYHYYTESKSVRAYELVSGTRTMNNMSESIELRDVIVLASYVDDNLYLVLLKEGGQEISILEVAGMRVVNTTRYSLPIALDGFINRNTYIEFYDAPQLDSFKGHARVKIFRTASDLYLVIDNKQFQPTGSSPDATHVLHLDQAGGVKYHKFPSTGEGDFGSFLYDGKLFQNYIGREKFSLMVYDLSGRQLMRYDLLADSLDVAKKDSPKVHLRDGIASVQGWDNFQSIFKQTGIRDPIIVVSESEHGYRVQLGSYYADRIGYFIPGLNAVTALTIFFATTAIKQVSEGRGISRYLYFETDLNTGKILPAELASSGLLRGRIDEYERKRQKKNNSPFESKSYIAFSDGVMAIYRLKPRERIGVTQLVYFD